MNKIFGFGLALLLVAGFSSCKPKQSAYKSVYEAAKERELKENSSTVVTKPTTTTTTTTTKPTTDGSVRSEKLTPVSEADVSGLKAYSVVVASMVVKPNAEAIRDRLRKEGYNAILAQNEQGNYRVIVASFDDKASAQAKRSEIMQKYSGLGDVNTLKKNYGIPFDDLWILQRLF